MTYATRARRLEAPPTTWVLYSPHIYIYIYIYIYHMKLINRLLRLCRRKFELQAAWFEIVLWKPRVRDIQIERGRHVTRSLEDALAYININSIDENFNVIIIIIIIIVILPYAFGWPCDVRNIHRLVETTRWTYAISHQISRQISNIYPCVNSSLTFTNANSRCHVTICIRSRVY